MACVLLILACMGGAPGYRLISTLALYLKTEQQIIAEREPTPNTQERVHHGGLTVGSGSSCWLSMSPCNPSYHIIGTTIPISPQL